MKSKSRLSKAALLSSSYGPQHCLPCEPVLKDSKRPAIHLLHFDGHGTFRPDRQGFLHGSVRTSTGEGLEAFEDKEGKLQPW